MLTKYDAIVMGAGPAGSSAAILLARAGWSIALIEKQAFPRRKVCGECIAASNLPLIEALGIAPGFDAGAGADLHQVALICGKRQVVADLPPARHARYRWGRALGRETLDTLLLEQARSTGVRVYQPWSVQAIQGEPAHWRCTIASADTGSTQTLHAPVAIDAHGSWASLPSARMRQRRRRKASDLLAFKANFHGAALEQGLLPVLLFDGGYGGMVVTGGGVTTVACCIRRDRLVACRRLSCRSSAGDTIEAMLKRECDAVRLTLQSASRDGPWLAAGPLDPGIHLHAVDGFFRIGNAAGEAHPIIGEGMSMALQSAWLLCANLLGAGHRDKLLEAEWQREIGRNYEMQWRRQFAPRLRLAAGFANMAMRPASAALIMDITAAWPGLLTMGARWGGKTSCAVDAAMIARFLNHNGNELTTIGDRT